MTLVVVGASVAGVRTAQALRMGGFTDAVVLIGEEPHVPYDKPPLSKHMITASGDPQPTPLLSVDEIDSLDVDLRLGERVTHLDPSSRTVTTADGGVTRYDHLVIATGVTPRTLPGVLPGGVHTLRTADDAVVLRRRLVTARDVVVIGAGFIGAEFASAARGHGCNVTIVEMQDVPMAHTLGESVGERLANLHRRAGVRLRLGVGVDSLRSSAEGVVEAVVLDDGTVLPADLVVVGIGARPAVDWLHGSGLPLHNGVQCDERLRVDGFPDIHAAGDVACWKHGLYETSVRIEHWTNAHEHAAIVAADLLGAAPPPPQVPYVWSDQYSHRIQIAGRPTLGHTTRVHDDGDESFTALYADRAGVLVAAVVLDRPRLFMKLRKAITTKQPAAQAAATLLP